MDQNAAVSDKLRELEESLWLAETRFDREYMEQILAPGFFEFGCSGRAYTRDEVIAVTPRAIRAKLPLGDFQMHPVTERVVQVTYKSEEGEDDARICRRSSIWVATAQGWRLRFHQGTAAQ
jgi:hypothetical protein